MKYVYINRGAYLERERERDVPAQSGTVKPMYGPKRRMMKESAKKWRASSITYTSGFMQHPLMYVQTYVGECVDTYAYLQVCAHTHTHTHT